MMTRRLFCLSVSCTLLVCGVPLAAQVPEPPEPIAPEREVDTYAVLSLLVPILQTPKKGYLIEEITTAPGWDAFSQAPVEKQKSDDHLSQIVKASLSDRGIQIDVPEDWRQQFREAARDYAKRSFGRVILQTKFMLALPYHLMDPMECKRYRYQFNPPQVQSRPWRSDRAVVRRYKGRGPLYQLSQVYFDTGHTLALVWARTRDTSNWYVFEKRDGGWRYAGWKSYGMAEEA